MKELNTKYVWKDIVMIDGKAYSEEFEISGETDSGMYDIDDFLNAVAEKHGCNVDNIKTYMMDDIDFENKGLKFGIEECGCYIDGVPEWELC